MPSKMKRKQAQRKRHKRWRRCCWLFVEVPFVDWRFSTINGVGVPPIDSPPQDLLSALVVLCPFERVPFKERNAWLTNYQVRYPLQNFKLLKAV